MKVSLRWACVWTILLCPLTDSLDAQETAFQRLSIQEGLSQSIVESIVQDRAGFMWFCTEDGLNRYDGYEFQVLRNDPDDPNSLSHNATTRILEDHSGNLWIGTNNGGLNCYNPATRTFRRYRFDPENPRSLSNDFIRALCVDRAGNLWVGTLNGLNLLTKSPGHPDSIEIRRIMNDPSDPGSLSANGIRSIIQDRKGTLWVGTEQGLDMMRRTGADSVAFVRFHPVESSLGPPTIRTIFEDREGNLWVGTDNGLTKMVQKGGRYSYVHYRNNAGDSRSLSNNQVYAIFEDYSGALWVGTNGGGLNLFNRELGEFTSFINEPQNPRSLSYNEIRSIYEDRSGNLWIGTYGGGISKVDRSRKHFVHQRHDPENHNSLGEAIVWCFEEDRDGGLWIGTQNGMDSYNRRTGRFAHYRTDPRNPFSLSHNIVRCILEDRSGVLWVGTGGGGVNVFDRKTGRFHRYLADAGDTTALGSNEVRSIFQDRSGTIWIGTLGGGLNRVIRLSGDRIAFRRYVPRRGDSTSLSHNFVRVVFEARDGKLWIGTYGGGISCYDPGTDLFRTWRASPEDPSGLSNDYVFCIHEDRSGYLWFGTWGGGLNRFDRTTETFIRFTAKDGLPSEAIYGILEDDLGNLWLSTNEGLARFDPETRKFRNFDEADGLQSNEFNGGAYYKTREGEMLFGGINGFNTFHPGRIKDNTFVPPVVLTSFSKLNTPVTFDRPLYDLEQIDLSYEDYVFSFEFAALDYTFPEKNRYAYKMEGLDPDWISTTAERRFAAYTTLPPGEYVFRVKGSNNDGVWNEEGASIRVIILPPFWRTWYFMVSSAVGALVFGFVLYRRRLRNERLRAELRQAHDAQMSILPQADPEIRGFDISGVCIPANEVGGDFFDYLLWNGGKTIGVVVGDVAGKAMKGAMTAVLSNGFVRAAATESHSAAAILSRVNPPLHAKTAKEMFVAVCIASFEAGRRSVSFANAGLVKPLLKTGTGIRTLDARGTTHPLGMFKTSRYSDRRIPLHRGDVLILLTDGIPEARNRNGEFYGDERLTMYLISLEAGSLSAAEISRAVLNDVAKFVGSAPQQDDMTVVAVKVL